MAVALAERRGVVPEVNFVEDPRTPKVLREHPVLNQFRDCFASAVKNVPPDQENFPDGSVQVARLGEAAEATIRMTWESGAMLRSVVVTASMPVRDFTPVGMAVLGVMSHRWHHEIMLRGNMPHSNDVPQLTPRLEEVMKASIIRAAGLKEGDLKSLRPATG